MSNVAILGIFVADLAFRAGRQPAMGETIMGSDFKMGPGGKGSNQAVAAGRAGARTLYVGAVGPDAFAASAQAFYRAERIGAKFVGKPRHATGTAAILVNAAGQNEIIVALGANAVLARKDVPLAALRRARVVVSQLESNLDTAAYVLRTARKAGATTVLNTAPMRPDFDPAILRHVDILVPNEPEFVALANALALGGRRDFTEAALGALALDELHALCRGLGVPVVILTLGASGCFVSQADGFSLLPAHDVKVVDTTGAGDAFVGGLAAGLVKFDGDILAAARFGNAVAALSVTKFGTAPSMPRAAEIAKFLR